MKQCIWCNRKEHDTSFKTLAHTFPQSIGGKKICKNVCDECNFAFGRKQQFQPSVDIAVKEIFNISKNIISTNTKQFQKNRFKSEYFKIDIELVNGLSIKLKTSDENFLSDLNMLISN